MFLKCSRRMKDGKVHHYWSIAENRRVGGGRVVQRHVLYLGEINDSQREAWRKTIEIFEDGKAHPSNIALFPEERLEPIDDEKIVCLSLKRLSLHRPRQWGGCWLACHLYAQLGLDEFWAERLPASRKKTRWSNVLKILTTYRLLDPGSEWKLYRQWYDQTAMGDLLAEDSSVAEIHKLYACHDKLLAHKRDFFTHLEKRWRDLFNSKFDILLYDLTSSYFESDPPFPENDKRRFGYSRDRRGDCVQVVIALIVTPEGFPIAYEVMPGNTADNTTLPAFLDKIHQQYGKSERIWVMDRGIPTEQVLGQMRESDPAIYYLVGTPKGRLSRLEKQLADKPWQEAREGVEVKLLPQDGELYVLAQSHDRIHKERGMRRRRLKKLWQRLKELQAMKQDRDDLLMRLGAAKKEAGGAWRLVEVDIPQSGTAFTFKLNKKKLRQARRREGRYLLRSNLCQEAPEKLWELYIQLTEIEEAFKNLKGDLSLRPFRHQLQQRIEAHIFIAFQAYCLLVTLRRRLRDLAPGLTPRQAIDKFRAVQMIDVHLPTTDGRTVIMSRYTQPDRDLQLLMRQMRLSFPAQPPPKITSIAPD